MWSLHVLSPGLTNGVQSQLPTDCSGGHYLPHFDAFENLDPASRGPGDIWVGNRMATAMFYLSDLVGGNTAFPNIGVAARPSRGSAVFWSVVGMRFNYC